MIRALPLLAVISLLFALGLAAARPEPALAKNPLSAVCGVGEYAPGAVGKVCKVVSGLGGVIGGIKKVLGFGGSSTSSKVAGAVAQKAAQAALFAAIGVAAGHAAAAMINEAAKIIGDKTSPQLRAAWFTPTYLKVAGLAVILTLPLLALAVIQALVRSDMAMLLHTALGALPLAIGSIFAAIPVTVLLLKSTDAMSTFVASSATGGDTHFLATYGGVAGGIGSALGGSWFLAVFGAVVIIAVGLALTLELLVRAAAIYVVVMMMPLAFATIVWPARRVIAVRMIELIVSLILSKFVIVAVLSLASGALGQVGSGGVGTVLAGMALLMMAAFSPWVLLRLIPFTEVAGHVGGALRGETGRWQQAAGRAGNVAASLENAMPESLGSFMGRSGAAGDPPGEPDPGFTPSDRIGPGADGGPALGAGDGGADDGGSGGGAPDRSGLGPRPGSGPGGSGAEAAIGDARPPAGLLPAGEADLSLGGDAAGTPRGGPNPSSPPSPDRVPAPRGAGGRASPGRGAAGAAPPDALDEFAPMPAGAAPAPGADTGLPALPSPGSTPPAGDGGDRSTRGPLDPRWRSGHGSWKEIEVGQTADRGPIRGPWNPESPPGEEEPLPESQPREGGPL